MMTWKNELVLVMGKFCAVLISIWITSTSNADGKALVEETTTPHNTDRVRACGVRLRHEIASICNLSSLRNNGYYIPGPPSIIEPRRNVPEEGSSTRQLSANNEIPTRTSRGVIEECCRKPCDRLQLLKYCASSEMKDKSTILETTTPPSDSLFLRKRTSMRKVNNKGRGRATSVESPETPEILDNCLHCGRGKNRTSSRHSGCVKTRRRNARRQKSQLDNGQTRLLPLLLQLLWDLDNMSKGSNLVKNYIPLKLPDALNRRQRPGSGRAISARDIYKNQFSFLQSGLIPSSDETISDTIGSVQSDSEESYQRPLIKNLASQVTDEPQPDFFPIPAGTNAEFFIL
ncbi:unnamed protein product [Allacma fusca]|uniref:Insulin-like domain-containing protein n=1 Tax=Allacma fusca TaxID=39272 RepID=A0A8J2PMV8_9HEXA|nr:unnamed protein product [Allacma fusca]